MSLSGALPIVIAGARAEWRQVVRSPLFLLLVMAHGLLLMSLVLLFGLTGSRAPVAVVLEDDSASARDFVQALRDCHHSFAIRTSDATQARAALARGSISAVITIPAHVGQQLSQGQAILIRLDLDNVNADLSEDIRRAVPAAIVAFGQQRTPTAFQLALQEHDAYDHDTGFIPYMAVSALAVDALGISALLAALVLIRDQEVRMRTTWCLAPRHPAILLCGRLLMAALWSLVALTPSLLVVLLLGIAPLHVLATLGGLGLILACGLTLGVALGTWIPHSALASALILGLTLALYLGSGAVEPQRFDGEPIWYLAHATPGYPAVAVLEYAVHDLMVAPEALWLQILVLISWIAGALLITRLRSTRWMPA